MGTEFFASYFSLSPSCPLSVVPGCPLSDGGSPITCHAIEVKGGEDEWNVVAIVADPRSFLVPNSTSDASGGSTEESRSSAPAPLILTHTIANLMPGTQYTFRVRCRNSLGVRVGWEVVKW